MYLPLIQSLGQEDCVLRMVTWITCLPLGGGGEALIRGVAPLIKIGTLTKQRESSAQPDRNSRCLLLVVLEAKVGGTCIQLGFAMVGVIARVS